MKNQTKLDECFGFCLFAIMLWALIWFCHGIWSDSFSAKILKQQAIEHGYAHYSVDSKGNTTFEWNNESPNKKTP